MKSRFLFACAFAGLGLNACGANGTSPPPPQNQVNPATNVLQLAVGTANIYGDAPASAVVGLNVVTTYRQPKGGTNPGASGTAVNSPTLTLPNKLPGTAGSPGAMPLDTTSTILTGPAPSEVSGTTMTSTAQTVGATTVTTFGTSGDVVGLGIEPFNYTESGTPFQVAPYPVPIYDALSPDANQLPAAWGGPPAFDLLGNGQSPVGASTVPAGTAGVSLGLDVFKGIAAVGGGAYNIKLSVPANTGTTTQTQSFTLPGAVHTLPAFTPPVPTLDANNDGGATFAVTLPAGVTEAYVEIVDSGPAQPTTGSATACNGASIATPIYYTIAVTSSGTVMLPPLAGPGGTPSICTATLNLAVMGNAAGTPGDSFSVQGLGFDYPLYEASYPKSLGNPSPTILGGSGEDDVTISSAPVSFQATAGAPLTTSVRRTGFRPR